MIQTKEDLAYYLSQDRKALGIANDGFVQRLRLLGYGAFKSHLGRLSIIIMHALEICFRKMWEGDNEVYVPITILMVCRPS